LGFFRQELDHLVHHFNVLLGIERAFFADLLPELLVGHILVAAQTGTIPDDGIQLCLVEGPAHWPVGTHGSQLGAVTLDDLGPVKF